MPKTNDATGATYAGNEGIVEHGAPLHDGRVLSEIDPERNLDGTLIEGDHPDHADGEERVVEGVATSDPQPIEGDSGVEHDDDQAKRGDRTRTGGAPVVEEKPSPNSVKTNARITGAKK